MKTFFRSLLLYNTQVLDSQVPHTQTTQDILSAPLNNKWSLLHCNLLIFRLITCHFQSVTVMVINAVYTIIFGKLSFRAFLVQKMMLLSLEPDYKTLIKLFIAKDEFQFLCKLSISSRNTFSTTHDGITASVVSGRNEVKTEYKFICA